MTDSIIYIKDSELQNMIMPSCICIYKNGHKYSLVEVNTGSYKNSIKPLTKCYDKIDEIIGIIENNHNQLIYPLLKNHIIYNDKN